MHIRFYRPEDDPVLMDLERQSPRGLPEPFVHYRRRFIDRAALFPDHRLLVAEHDGAIAGTAAVIVKRTRIGGEPLSLGYVFDVRAAPALRRRGIGQSLLAAIDEVLIARGVDGVYAHIVASNMPSLKLFAKLGYQTLRPIALLVFQPLPASHVPRWTPRLTVDPAAGQDRIAAVHGARDLYVPGVAERVKHLGFERWSVDLGDGGFAGMSLFDQGGVFQQWPADLPFLSEQEMQQRDQKSLRLFDEVGSDNAALLRSVFDALRDRAARGNVSNLTLLVDPMDRVPAFFFAEAARQMDYWMVFKPLRPGWTPAWQDGPIYLDAREL